jgi:hypothetical protein
LITNIKGHHFDLGADKNDFKTTTGANYAYDSHKAINAKSNLDQKLKNDLRASHYKLGYMPDTHFTTHQATYQPLELNKKQNHDPQLRQSHFNLNATNSNKFNNKTIYMIDYVKKEIVD